MTKLVVLDLDSTLIYSTKEKLREPDFMVDGYNVYKRPGLDTFLEFCFANFQVGVWSSAAESYVDEIVKNIFKDPKKLLFKWTKNECTSPAEVYHIDVTDDSPLSKKVVKDLEKLARTLNFSMGEIVAVDDAPRLHYKNDSRVVCALKWEGSLDDRVLYNIMTRLPNI